VGLVALQKLSLEVLPQGEEPDGYAESDGEEDDELDINKPRQFGKQSSRARTQTKVFGFQVDPTRIEIEQEPAAASH
jgi:hypothetical protein